MGAGLVHAPRLDRFGFLAAAGFGVANTLGFVGFKLVQTGFAIRVRLAKAFGVRISGGLATNLAPLAQAFLFLF